MIKMLTVLIVEDEPVNRKILKKLLKEKYEVLEAENGAVAWEMLTERKEHISAVLLDLVMPVMNGYELLTKMQESHMDDVPVIVTTGATDEDAEHRALDIGAWDYVTKPYNAKVLYSRLQNAIARSELPALEKLRYVSEHDELTGLYNRSKLFAETRSMVVSHPDMQFVFVRVDIDHFALFNTSFGENEGNELLKFMARCITDMAKEHTYCTYGRINADRFCFCTTYSGTPEKLEDRVEYAQKQLAMYRKDYRLEISAGAYVIDDMSLSVEDYYFRTSIAAQKCKNQVDRHLSFYDKDAGEKMATEIVIINEMQTALDEHQFVVYFQPKVSISKERVCGSEALVRWKHPVKGMVSPGDFIPVFEKNGFIFKLDYYVWEETCRLLSEWQKKGNTLLPVSVNISRVSLYNPQLADIITDLIHKYDIPAAFFQLEFTESAYMTNPELMEKTIEVLHNAGFTILMDDFGSGYSSLNTLKRIKVDVLKIDMKFLPVNDETERGEIILSSIIKMAHWLGMSVVVEGVETRRQRDFLEGAGCDYIQGYYYSRPIPRKEYEEKYLSCIVPDEEDVQEESGEAVPHHNMTILVIDDSEVDRGALQTMFSEMYNVHMCENAEEGLAYLKRNSSRVRLILVDNIMPGMGGLEFLRYCRQDNIFSAIPKIMITANDTVEDQVQAFEEGAYDYIVKPFVREIVLARVEHVMDISVRTSIFDSVEQEYSKNTEVDASTKLLNKMAFKRLSTKVMENLPDDQEALLVLDIDGFEEINEHYGRETGDSVIRCIAEEMSRAFRKTDIVGHFGGDEFAVFMTKLPDTEIAKRKSEELVKNINQACLKKLNIDVSVSIGLALSQWGDIVDTMIARADQGLYKAKSTGKGKSVVYGEKVPPIVDDNKPIALICSDDFKLYSGIALSYGKDAAFACVKDCDELKAMFLQYKKRICAICIDTTKKIEEGSGTLYQYVIEKARENSIPVLGICDEGNIEQLREAVKLQIDDVLTIPPQKDVIRRQISRALTKQE